MIVGDVLPKKSWLKGPKIAQNGQKLELLLVAKTLFQPLFSDVFSGFKYFLCFFNATIETTFFQLFPMVAIVGLIGMTGFTGITEINKITGITGITKHRTKMSDLKYIKIINDKCCN